MDDAAYRRATAVGEALVEHGPLAASAGYDAGSRQVVIRLRSGLELRVAPESVEGLQGASDEDLAAVEVEPPGLQLCWGRLDASLFLPYLVEEKLGDGRWVGPIHGPAGGRLSGPVAARRGGWSRRRSWKNRFARAEAS